MRILKALALPFLLSLTASVLAQALANGAAAGCARCHAAQTLKQPETPMGRALLTGANPTLQANPKLSVRKGTFTYTVETHGEASTYSVTDGVRTLSLPIRWTFGVGAQTWILERDGRLYESLVSYYPSIHGLDTTTGDESLKPGTLEEAMGRELKPGDSRDCFGCHASHSVADGKLNLAALQPGVNCEHCHVGSSTHLVDALQGVMDSAPPDLRKLGPEDIASFCGQCHRTWETVVRNRWRGEANVRFQPYRLANSRCYSGTDPRIGCLACHDPHQDLVQQDSSYDAKCLACHGSASGSAVSTRVAKTCPVAKENCVQCHMPKVTLPGGLMTFTDHQIRVVRKGEVYPN